jgi:RNA exonuclease 4
MLTHHGISLAQAKAAVRQCLPRSATLVGQNIGRDVEWLQLKEGVDFKARLVSA